MYNFGIGNNGYLGTVGAAEYGSRGLKGNLYSFKHYCNNILVRNFVPCKRIIDNTIGLYDLIHEEFFINRGEGEVLAGPNNTNLIFSGTIDPGGAYLYGSDGYKDGPRWSNSGGGIVPNYPSGRLSGWIPYKKGTLFIKNFGLSSINQSYVSGCYLIYYYNDGTIATYTTGSQSTDEYSTIFDNDSILYFRVSGKYYDTSVQEPFSLPIITII